MTATERALAEHVASFVRPDDPGTDDLEWSDLGRDPRYLPGWWILPGAIIGLVAWGAIIWGLLEMGRGV